MVASGNFPVESHIFIPRIRTFQSGPEERRFSHVFMRSPYDPEAASLTTMKLRKAFVMSLNPGMREEYERRHNPIWPELEAVLKEHGVSNYSIFLLEETHQLFAYAESEDESRWAAIARTDVCRRWWERMADVMASHPDHSPVAKDLAELFHLV